MHYTPIDEIPMSNLVGNKRVRYAEYMQAAEHRINRETDPQQHRHNNKTSFTREEMAHDLPIIQGIKQILLNGICAEIGGDTQDNDIDIEDIYKTARGLYKKYKSKRQPGRYMEDGEPIKDVITRYRWHYEKTIKQNYQLRIMEQAATAMKNNWPMIFTTLTVDDHHYQEVFKTGSRAMEKHVRAIRRLVNRTFGLTGRDNRDKRLHHHSYFACTERGAKGGRLHIHLLHICEGLPITVKDCPNRGRFHTPPKEQSMTSYQFTRTWRHGISDWIPVRTSPTDYWGKREFVWPAELVNDTPGIEQYTDIRSNGLGSIEQYLTKYITKARQGNKYHWRTKISQGFGLATLRNTLAQLDSELLRTVCAHSMISDITLSNGTIIHNSMIQKTATWLLAKRLDDRQTIAPTRRATLTNTIKPENYQHV